MPRKTAAERAAEKEALAEAARRETEQRRLKWVGVAIIALALFAGGYAAGQASSDDVPTAFLPFEGGPSPAIDVPFADLPGFYGEFHDELPPFVEFDPGRFDRPRERFQRDLVCDIVERDGRVLHLVCERLGFPERGVPEDERPRDERPDDGSRVEEPGFLGVGIAQTDLGVTVVELLGEGPAAMAGIELDDVIVAFGDIPIESGEQLADLITEAGAGAEVPITVLRFDSEVTVRVVLGEPPR
jgi:membrane-associated protease RseP (regulator of RpoE activity)